MLPSRIDWNARELTLHWDGGHAPTQLDAAMVRQACRCAECLHCPPRPDAAVRLASMELVGHYGVRLFFSDTHSRGIFPWSLLRELGQENAVQGPPQ